MGWHTVDSVQRELSGNRDAEPGRLFRRLRCDGMAQSSVATASLLLLALQRFSCSQFSEESGVVTSILGCAFQCLAVYHEVIFHTITEYSTQDDQPHELGVPFLQELEER